MKISTLQRKAEQALKEAIYDLVKNKAKENKRLVIWEDGKVVTIPARTCMRNFKIKRRKV